MAYERERPRKQRGRFRGIFSLRNHHGQWHVGRISASITMVLLIGFVFFFTMLYGLGVGQAGMIVDPMAKTIGSPITGPVYGIKMPWQNIVKVPYARESLGMWGDGTDEYADFPAIDCFDKDGLELKVDIMIRWQLDLNKIKDLYNSYPSLNWEDRAVASVSRKSIRYVIGETKTMFIVENRESVALQIEETLIKEITSEASLFGAIINIEVDLRNIGLPVKITTAIEDKLAAEQAKIQAEYEASKIITLANADAQALLIGANATAEQKIIDAYGIQEAINTLVNSANMTDPEFNEFLTLYVQLTALKYIAEQEGTTFIVGIEGGNVFIQPSN